MTIPLTPEEKIAIIEQHIKAALYSQYNINLSLVEANASTLPNQQNITDLNSQLADITVRITDLQAEIDEQTALIAPVTN